MKRLLSFGLLLFLSCSVTQDVQRVSLVPLLPYANQEVVLAARGPVGAAEAQPFLGPGFEVNRALGTARALQNEVSVSFHCFRLEDLSLSLEVMAPTTEEIVVMLNNHRLGSLAATSDWTTGTLSVPSRHLERGPNKLTLQAADRCTLREFSLRPSRPFQPVVADGDSLVIPAGGFVELPLENSLDTVFRADLEPWPGTEDWELKITLASDEAPKLLETSYSTGQPVELALPPLGRPVTLKLEATKNSGVRVRRPVLSFGGMEAQPSQAPLYVPPSKHPNIILLVVDTLRADRLTLYGYAHPTAPSLERLAADAVTYSDVTAEAPWTKPSIATILTSLDTKKHGVAELFDVLPAECLTLAETLQANGYQTAAIIANPLLGKDFGYSQGFGHFEVLEHQSRAESVFDRANQWLASRDPQRPFLLYLHLFDPHVPYDPPSEYAATWLRRHGLQSSPGVESWTANGQDHWLAGYLALTLELERECQTGHATRSPGMVEQGSALYDGEIEYTDRQLGRWLETIKELGLYDDSMIVFTSDHGEEFGEHGHLGHLHSLYQQLLAVPLLIKFPTNVRAGECITESCHHLDILPTILEVAGLPTPAKAMGRSLTRQAAPVPHLSRVDAGSEATRLAKLSDEHKATVGHSRGYSLRSGNLKFIRFEASRVPVAPLALYDLSKDPGELNNLAPERPATLLWLNSLVARRLTGSSTITPKRENPGSLESLPYLR